MAKPFQPVEKLPVPDNVRENFRNLRSKEAGSAISSSHAMRSPLGSSARKAAERAAQKYDEAAEVAAKHFGGDKEKMFTHFKRWVRSKGAFMSVSPGDVIPKESIEKGMKKADDIKASKSKVSKVVEKYPSTRKTRGA